MCNLLSLRGGSAIPNPIIASPFPTKTSTLIPTATVAGMATPAGTAHATLTPAPPPAPEGAATFVPATQTRGRALRIVGSNLYLANPLTIISRSTAFAPTTVTSGCVVASEGPGIPLLYPIGDRCRPAMCRSP